MANTLSLNTINSKTGTMPRKEKTPPSSVATKPLTSKASTTKLKSTDVSFVKLFVSRSGQSHPSKHEAILDNAQAIALESLVPFFVNTTDVTRMAAADIVSDLFGDIDIDNKLDTLKELRQRIDAVLAYVENEHSTSVQEEKAK